MSSNRSTIRDLQGPFDRRPPQPQQPWREVGEGMSDSDSDESTKETQDHKKHAHSASPIQAIPPDSNPQERFLLERYQELLLGDATTSIDHDEKKTNEANPPSPDRYNGTSTDGVGAVLHPTDDASFTDDDGSTTIGSHTTTTSRTTIEPYHIFPLQRMLPTMFPYHEPTGGSICAMSKNTVDSLPTKASQEIDGDHTTPTTSTTTRSLCSFETGTVQSTATHRTIEDEEEESISYVHLEGPTTSEDVALVLQDLHTRQLLDELEIQELYKSRDAIPGTSEYHQRMDQLDQEMKALMGQQMQRMTSTQDDNDKTEILLHEKIAVLAQEIGNTTTAQQALEKSLSMKRRLCNGESNHNHHKSEVADALYQLGMLLSEAGDYENAMDRFVEALNLRRQGLGDKHMLVGDTFYSMGCTVRHQGFYNTALDFFEESLAIRQSSSSHHHHLGGGSSHRQQLQQIGDTLETIGCLHAEHGNKEKALACLQQALRIRRQQLTGGGSHTSRNQLWMAATLKHMFNLYREIPQHHALAVDYFEEWLVILGDLYSGLGHTAEMVKCYREALTIRASIFGAYERCSGSALLKSADLYFKNGETQSALKLYSKFIENFNECGTDDEHEQGACFYALLLKGHCYFIMDGNLRSEEARGCFYAAADLQHDLNVCGGTVSVEDVLFKLLRAVSNTRLGKMVERVKWMARTRGNAVEEDKEPPKWRSWLGNRITGSSKSFSSTS